MAKTRFFRVAVEGATTDGRTIERQWLADAAATYNRETYAARVNMEHIRGITADKPFKAYGDVLSLKTEEIDITIAGKTEKKLALFAELDVTDELAAINRDRQKIFTSIEISPNFANTGKAYLVGLAVTDSPASLGTEMLQFAASQGENNPLAARKQDKANLFTAAEETVIELAEAAPANPDPTGVFASIKSFFDNFGKTGTTAAQQQSQTPPEGQQAGAPTAAPQSGDAAAFAGFGAIMTQMATAMTEQANATQTALTQLTADLKAVTDKVEGTPAHGFTQRTPATGGGANDVRTDC